MTPQQPQQEYIITEEQLKVFGVTQAEIEAGINFADRLVALKEIRSRPLVAHTSSTEAPICDRCKTDQEPFCIGCERLIPHDTAIRNETLDNILSFISAYEEYIGLDNIDGFEIYGVKSVNLKEHIESLHKQEEP